MTWGGTGRARRARTAATALVATLALVPALAACSRGIDQAHSVQTRLGRLDDLVATDVTVASPSQGARIEVEVVAGLAPRRVVEIAQQIDEVAEAEDYRPYRLELRESDHPDDSLLVDDGFQATPSAIDVVAGWRRVVSASVGSVAMVAELGTRTVEIDSGPALLHDVTEAARLPAALRVSTWTFRADPATVVVAGAVGQGDVEVTGRVQRELGSPSLPVGAERWRLASYADHLQLDVDADLPADLVAQYLTRTTWGSRLEPLAGAAVTAVAVSRTPVWVRLVHATESGDDVFAWWTSGRPVTPGRDRLARGWDRWLQTIARG